jgi:hypothetical protein
MNLRDADAEFAHVRYRLKCKRDTAGKERAARAVIA